jgi:hypothetical protein
MYGIDGCFHRRCVVLVLLFNDKWRERMYMDTRWVSAQHCVDIDHDRQVHSVSNVPCTHDVLNGVLSVYSYGSVCYEGVLFLWFFLWFVCLGESVGFHLPTGACPSPPSFRQRHAYCFNKPFASTWSRMRKTISTTVSVHKAMLLLLPYTAVACSKQNALAASTGGCW